MSHCIKNGKLNENLCQNIIDGKTFPKTALELMVSRYYAFKTSNIEYIKKTQTVKWSKEEEAEALFWAKNSFWQHLEIIDYCENEVEFKAYYIYNGKQELLHERSSFIKKDGKWLYERGTLYNTKADIARNAKCICQSGKKYKQCCLKRLG